MNKTLIKNETINKPDKLNFSRLLNSIAKRFPHWIFRYNKACLLHSQMFEFEKEPRSGIKAREAKKTDIDTINRISGISKKQIEYLMDAGVTCFLASIGDDPPASVAWNAVGRCYIRGMGFEYDFGDDGAYGYWSATLPEARGMGLHYALMVAKASYAKNHGAQYLYSMIEFDNELSYKIRIKTGYKPIMEIYFLKIFNIKFIRVKNLQTQKSKFKGFYKQPLKDSKII